ncbi:MAG: hypothetical protein ACT4O9_03630 [Blastocatellia bacterium]
MNDETKTNAESAEPEKETPAETFENSPEAARLRAENEELKLAMRVRNARDTIMRELTAAGARSPELLFAAVKADLQFDADGKLANTAALIEQVKQSFPEQFIREKSADSIDGGAGAGNSARFLTREALSKMKPAEIARLDLNDVRTVLANG